MPPSADLLNLFLNDAFHCNQLMAVRLLRHGDYKVVINQEQAFNLAFVVGI